LARTLARPLKASSPVLSASRKPSLILSGKSIFIAFSTGGRKEKLNSHSSALLMAPEM